MRTRKFKESLQLEESSRKDKSDYELRVFIEQMGFWNPTWDVNSTNFQKIQVDWSQFPMLQLTK